jgi:hypothetical protein
MSYVLFHQDRARMLALLLLGAKFIYGGLI